MSKKKNYKDNKKQEIQAKKEVKATQAAKKEVKAAKAEAAKASAAKVAEAKASEAAKAPKAGIVPLAMQGNTPYMEKVCAVFAFVILALFALFIGPQEYVNITEVKFYSFVTVTCIFIVAIVIALIAVLAKRKEPGARQLGFKKQITLPQLFITLFMVWGLISAAMSEYDELFIGESRYEGVLSMLLYGCIFIIMSAWGEYSNRNIYGMAIAAIIIGFISFLQLMGSDMIYPDGMSYGTTLFLGTIGNVDCVSGIISIMLPTLSVAYVLQESKWRYASLVAIALLMYVQVAMGVDAGRLAIPAALVVSIPFLVNSKKRITRMLDVLGVITLGTALWKLFPSTYDSVNSIYTHAATASKMGILCLILAIACAVGGYLLRKSKKEINLEPKKTALIAWGVVAALVVVVLIYLYMYSGSSDTLLGQARDVLHGHMSDDAGSGRGVVWKRTLKIIKANPIFGVGPGAYLNAFAPYNVDLDVTFDFAHNDFLQIATCEGLVGLALYLGFLGTLAYRGFKKALKCPWVLVCISACTGFLVYAFFTFSIAIVSPLFWVAAGMLDHMVRSIPSDAEGLVWAPDELGYARPESKVLTRQERRRQERQGNK